METDWTEARSSIQPPQGHLQITQEAVGVRNYIVSSWTVGIRPVCVTTRTVLNTTSPHGDLPEISGHICTQCIAQSLIGQRHTHKARYSRSVLRLPAIRDIMVSSFCLGLYKFGVRILPMSN
jgi:hypothetical protein